MSRIAVLTQMATDLLRQSPLPALRCLMVTETDREVIISGRVWSYYQKQIAQETVRPSLGERRLFNQVTVELD